MDDLDPENKGKINETNFVNNILNIYDNEDQLRDLLRFDLIPDEALREAHMEPSLPGSQLNMRKTSVNNYLLLNFLEILFFFQSSKGNLKIEIDDDLLDSIAKKVAKKDWEKLAMKLGYSNSEIQTLKTKKSKADSYDLVRFIFYFRKFNLS